MNETAVGSADSEPEVEIMLGRVSWVVLSGIAGAAWSTGPVIAADADLAGYRTVKTAITAKIDRTPPKATAQPAYLGVHLETDPAGRPVVDTIEPDSPGASTGLKPGDVVRAFDGKPVSRVEAFRELLRSKMPGDVVTVAVERGGSAHEFLVKLGAVSRPISPTARRALLGVQMGESDFGARIDRLTTGMPAAAAGMRPGDVIVAIDGVAITGPDRLNAELSDRKPGDLVSVVLQRPAAKRRGGPVASAAARFAQARADTQLLFKVKLAAEPGPIGKGGRDDALPSAWRKDLYRLAVVQVEYPDVKHNPKIDAKHWEAALFSRNSYNDKSATGQPVYGSMNDYYHELSCGKFRVEGKVFPYVQVAKKRNDYAADPNRFALLQEALDKLHARDGARCLDDFDGIFFLYAGNRVQTQRGGIYWPHRSNVNYKGKRWSYFICPEGGDRMASISVISHEFGHMLGLPDLYARPETPGAEGVGVWCTMSTGHGNDGKPLHFSAWCKEQLGWLTPTVIDPTVRQKLILAPVIHTTGECFKVLVKPDASEYLLLENRISRGFDKNLPGEGLLIWRVVDGRPFLEESHGIPGPDGPLRFLGSVPYPSKSNNAFTPDTTPSSRGVKPGGLPVHITNIRKLPDGRITFWIGYEYL